MVGVLIGLGIVLLGLVVGSIIWWGFGLGCYDERR